MMRFEVQTDQVDPAGARQAEIAGRIAELSGRLTPASSAACAAGHPAVSAAMGSCLSRWQSSHAPAEGPVQRPRRTVGRAGYCSRG